MKKIYNKLVRDKIPEIIEKNGEKCIIETLSEEEYEKMLITKLDEELKEFKESKEPEELADLMEVIFALSELKGTSERKLMSIRNKKKKSRGGFAKRILLKEVE